MIQPERNAVDVTMQLLAGTGKTLEELAKTFMKDSVENVLTDESSGLSKNPLGSVMQHLHSLLVNMKRQARPIRVSVRIRILLLRKAHKPKLNEFFKVVND